MLRHLSHKYAVDQMRDKTHHITMYHLQFDISVGHELVFHLLCDYKHLLQHTILVGYASNETYQTQMNMVSLELSLSSCT